jgi:fucose permease
VRASLADPDRRRLLIAGALGFLAMGALQAVYGPAFPTLARRFDVGLDAVAQTVALHFAGSFLTIATAGPLLARLGYRLPLTLGALGMAAGAGLVAAAPSLAWLLAGAALGGLGYGLLVVALNLRVARAFAPNAAPALNGLNAVFGVGAVAGPGAVALAGGGLGAPMAAMALGALALAWLLARLPEPGAPAAGPRARLPWAAAGGFVAMYFLYVAAEVGVGSWETVHLAPTVGERAAAVHASLYWGALTVGRLLAAPLSARLRPAGLVLGASALALAALSAAHVPAWAPFAYPVVGLAFAPIFPTGLAWLQRVVPRRSEAVASAVLAAATLGPVATAGPIGAAVEAAGSARVPTLLAALTAGLLLVVAGLWAGTRRA